MATHPHAELARRERQIVETLLRLGRGSVAEVREALPDPPSYSAVRTMLGLLERKGYVRHTEDGPRYIYHPALPKENARVSALSHLVRTFFGGSRERAMVALLDLSDEPLSEAQLDRLRRLVDEAEERAEGPEEGDGGEPE